MARITGNRLLLLSVLGFAAYWIVGLASPKPYIASVASLMLLILSGLTLWRYAPTTARILFFGQRSDDNGAEGSHLAVYGIFLVAMGLHYSAWYRLVWLYFGTPMEWTNSAYSSAGISTAAVGLCLLYFSPDVSRTEMKTPNTIWLVMMVAAGLLFAFFLGTKSAVDETTRLAMMGDGCPVVASPNSRKYHDASSPYRAMVKNPICFPTAAAADAAGFKRGG